jgi:Na+/H+ antiporter NhaD/arsenite permease-like protein
MPDDTLIAALLFVGAYVLIAVERWDRTLIALLTAMVMVLLGIVDQHEAFAAIDLNVIFLLVGMMIIASILARTGFFEWLAIRSVVLSDGHPIRLLLILSLVTAVVSAFLDNVTTVVLMTPVTLSVARRLGVSPAPYLIAQILASNIGGTATLIGDPPNILIGSAAGLGFGAFLWNLAPVVILIFIAFAGIMALTYRNVLKVPDERRLEAVEATKVRVITDNGLLIKALVVTTLTIVGFLAHSALGVEVATVALLGATVLMLLVGDQPEMTLPHVEWSTIFFFVGLFIMVEGIIQAGIVGGIAERIAEAANGDVAVASLAILWFSAGASAIIDNIPYTATAIPVVQQLVDSGMAPDALWWSLALGACLGGNLTIIGASANVVVSNMADREGHPITFFMFLKYGAMTVAASMVISTIYVWIRYLG